MLNQLVLVGRLLDKPTVKETEDGRKVSYMKVAVTRNYKNTNGEYDTDVITVVLWNALAVNYDNFCNKGDLVGVKGRLENNNNTLVVIGEKITLLSSDKE